MRKRLLALVLILCLFNSIPSIFALSDGNDLVQGSYKWDSPFGYTQKTYSKYATTSSTIMGYTPVYSQGEVAELIRQALYNRQATLQVNYIADTTNLGENLKAMINEIIDADHYLRYNMSSWEFSYSGYVGDVNIDFGFAYLTTLSQEQFVDSETTRILNQIIYPEMDNHQKVRAVHDYIVAHVAYDTDLIEHSAYAALSKGITVCQGYALLAFKMIDQLGIPVQIIEGYANGGAHAWNLVNLDGAWYHLDATWDDPVPDVPGRIVYDYYNITDSQISADHTWETINYPACTTTYTAPAYGIIKFSVPGQLRQTLINNTNRTITFYMPKGANIKALIPDITIWTGATISPALGSMRDFTLPVNYRVTRLDGIIENWTVRCELLSAGDLNLDGKIDIDDLTILSLSYGHKTADAGFDIRADINVDGIVDIQDLNILKMDYR